MKKPRIPTNPYATEGRIGFWGYVSKVHSDSLTVDVVSDANCEYRYIQVASRQWVNADDKSGCRDLPSEGSRVFVIKPEKSAANAFVLCSGFGQGEQPELDGFTAESSMQTEVEKANNSTYEKNPAGWVTKTDRTNGNIEFTSDDENIKVEIIPESTDKEVKLTAWNNTITINSDGITIETQNKISLSGNTGIEVDAKTGKLGLKNSVADLKSQLDSICNIIQGIITPMTITSPTGPCVYANAGTDLVNLNIAKQMIDSILE